jgi:membrane-associated protease RseP (regulator of RpoE activity)
MKKAIAIIILGLMWCNVGVAATYKLERCHIYNTTPVIDKLPDNYKVFVSQKFDPLNFEKFAFEINTDSKTIKKNILQPAVYRLGFQPDDSYSGEGVKILKVSPDSPAKKAKLKRKDIILAYDGKRVSSLNDSLEYLKSYASNKPGSPVEITFKRKKKIKTVMLTPKLLPRYSHMDIYNITFHDGRSAEGRHQSYPDYNQLKINIEAGTVVNGVVISQTESVQYYIQCSKDSKPEKSVELVTLIKEAKNTCKDLGFKEGTEKFAECGLKLYTKNIDKISEKKDVVIVQSPQTTSTSNTMTIYDPVRDSNALIKQGMKMLSGGCTLGIDC